MDSEFVVGGGFRLSITWVKVRRGVSVWCGEAVGWYGSGERRKGVRVMRISNYYFGIRYFGVVTVLFRGLRIDFR